jgi:hypothetical protein
MGCRPEEAGLTITCARCGKWLKIPGAQPACLTPVHSPPVQQPPTARNDQDLPRAVPVSRLASPLARRRPNLVLCCVLVGQAVLFFWLGAYAFRQWSGAGTPAVTTFASTPKAHSPADLETAPKLQTKATIAAAEKPTGTGLLKGADPAAETPAPPPAVKKALPKKAEGAVATPAWADAAKKPVRLGDLELTVKVAFADSPGYFNAAGGSANVGQVCQLLILEIANTHKTKVRPYASWQQTGGATMKDEHGNQYAQVRPPGAVQMGIFSEQNYFQFTESEIRPDTKVLDMLVFRLPVKQADHLYIELSGANVGTEPIRLHLTREFFDRKMNAPGPLIRPK